MARIAAPPKSNRPRLLGADWVELRSSYFFFFLAGAFFFVAFFID